MGQKVSLPDHILRDVQKLVDKGIYPDMTSAISELVRLGLQQKKQKGKQRGGKPDLPSSEKPTSTEPHDVNWM